MAYLSAGRSGRRMLRSPTITERINPYTEPCSLAVPPRRGAQESSDTVGATPHRLAYRFGSSPSNHEIVHGKRRITANSPRCQSFSTSDRSVSSPGRATTLSPGEALQTGPWRTYPRSIPVSTHTWTRHLSLTQRCFEKRLLRLDGRSRRATPTAGALRLGSACTSDPIQRHGSSGPPWAHVCLTGGGFSLAILAAAQRRFSTLSASRAILPFSRSIPPASAPTLVSRRAARTDLALISKSVNHRGPSLMTPLSPSHVPLAVRRFAYRRKATRPPPTLVPCPSKSPST